MYLCVGRVFCPRTLFALGLLLLFSVFFVPGTRADGIDDLIKEINDVSAKLSQLPPGNADLKKAVTALSTAIKAYDCTGTSTDTYICRLKITVQELVDAIDKNLTANPSIPLTTQQTKDIETQLTTLAANIQVGQRTGPTPISTAPDPTATATELATLLGTQLKVKGVDRTNTDLAAALKALSPTPSTSTIINVLGAYFGDLNFIDYAINTDRLLAIDVDDGRYFAAKDPRFCSATRVMRNNCQGKASCFNDITGADKTSHVTGTEMCGFDPVPYANPASKGLAVFFECLTTDASDPSLNQDRPIAYNRGQIPKKAYLHLNEVAGIYCSSPSTPSPKGGQGTQTSGNSSAIVNVISGGTNTITGSSPTGSSPTGANTPSGTTPAPAATPAAPGAASPAGGG